MKDKRNLGILILFSLFSILVSCKAGVPISQTKTFREALDFKPEDRWVVLARPNSIWKLGTIVELKDDGSIEDIGNIREINCFPNEVIIEDEGNAPSSAYSSLIDYNLSLTATLGLPSNEIAKAGLSFGSDGKTPSHKNALKLEKATERRWSYVKLEEYILDNFESLNRSCKRTLLDPNRFILDKIYQINKGSFEVIGSNGVQVDLSTPKYKAIADAAIKAGYKITKEGSLTINEEGEPITFAVRRADFEKILSELGVLTKGTEPQKFEKAMRDAGASVPY